MNKKIKTDIGDFYISDEEEKEYFYCKLYDSNKDWVANIYNEGTIKSLRKIKNCEDLVNLGIGNNAIWDRDLRKLFYMFCEIVEEENTDENFEIFKGYVNKIGDIYFVLDFDEF